MKNRDATRDPRDLFRTSIRRTWRADELRIGLRDFLVAPVRPSAASVSRRRWHGTEVRTIPVRSDPRPAGVLARPSISNVLLFLAARQTGTYLPTAALF